MKDLLEPFEQSEERGRWSARIPTIAYALGLSIIAILATVIWLTTIAMVTAQGQLAAEINVAGRQRMLTQKIALLSSRLDSAQPAETRDLIDEISACADLLERAHQIMLSRDLEALQATAAEGTRCTPGRIDPPPVGEMSETLRLAYFDGPEPVDPRLTGFLERVRAITDRRTSSGPEADRLQAEIYTIAHVDLPDRLDHVVQVMQHEGEAWIDRLVRTKTAMWIATLVLLVLEVLFIFRPMVRRIDRTIRSLKDITYSLAERRRAEHELRMANNAKTRFLAQMSHELRTPLNAIIGYSQMLTAAQSLKIPPEKQEEYAGDIKASGEHLLDLVNDLLDLSRIETDTITVIEEIVDVGRILGGVAAMMRTQAGARGQQVVVNRSDFPVAARVDERLLRQALINLVDNALKYGAENGQVRIEFSQRNHDEVEIVVEDDGIGFDMKDLPVLMEPFARAETDPTIAPEGVGLGLPLAKRLIELQGGTLTMTSTPGVGTRAVVRVPSVERSFLGQRAAD